MTTEDKIKNIEKKLNVLRSVASEALTELAELKEKQAPEKPIKQKSRKEQAMEEIAQSYLTGRFRKPTELRRSKN